MVYFLHHQSYERLIRVYLKRVQLSFHCLNDWNSINLTKIKIICFKFLNQCDKLRCIMAQNRIAGEVLLSMLAPFSINAGTTSSFSEWRRNISCNIITNCDFDLLIYIFETHDQPFIVAKSSAVLLSLVFAWTSKPLWIKKAVTAALPETLNVQKIFERQVQLFLSWQCWLSIDTSMSKLISLKIFGSHYCDSILNILVY